MVRSALTASAALFLLTVSAQAEATSAQRAACTPDVLRLCATEIPDVGAIKVCLRRERTSLSTSCRSVMDAADAADRKLASAPAPVRTVR